MTGPHLPIDTNIGCILVGVIVSLPFYGCTCAQIIYYATNYPNDKMWLKCLVAFLWLLDTANTCEAIQFAWSYVVTGHATPAALQTLPRAGSAEGEVGLQAIAILIVQSFYIHTIWMLLREKWYRIPLTLLMLALALVSCATGFAMVVLARIYELQGIPSDVIFSHNKVAGPLEPLAASVTDIYITISLCILLHKKRAVTRIKRSEMIIQKLTMYAINRGLLTSISQTLSFVTFTFLNKSDYYWLVFHIPLCKLYVNSMFAVLNARQSLAETRSAHATMRSQQESIPLESLRGSGRLGSVFGRPTSTPPVGESGIIITSEVLHHEDIDGIPFDSEIEAHSRFTKRLYSFAGQRPSVELFPKF